MTSTVFLTYPRAWNEAAVSAFVSQAGTVTALKLCRDFTTRELRGEAFLTFETPDKARSGAARLNGFAAADGNAVIRASVVGEGGHRVAVIGAGLAGLAAALEAAENGAEVTVFDKETRVGGNSAKASSGMNAVGTPTQTGLGIEDSTELFEEDTTRSGKGLSDHKMVTALAEDSREAWEWLAGQGVALNSVSQCGGHSRARTHKRAPVEGERATNVGWDLISALKVKAEDHPGICIVTGAWVTEIVMGDWCATAVKYSLTPPVPRGDDIGEADAADPATIDLVMQVDAVIVATGGFSASREVLETHVPDKAGLPTTNGAFATGDGIRLLQDVGALVTQMDQVQVHPTGFVDPSDPQAGTKILAPEALRAHGGMLLDGAAARFVDELETRDNVTAAIFEHCAPFGGQEGGHVSAWLLMTQAVVDAYSPASFAFYQFKGLVTQHESLAAVAEAAGVDVDALAETVAAYNNAAMGKADDAVGRTVFKAPFPVDGGDGGGAVYYLAAITPALHYTMGGVAIGAEGQVLAATNTQAIPGLFAAGEVTGGVHGGNRLAGNSLLECVVFGRRAGRSATRRIAMPALSPSEWTALELLERVDLSPTTALFRFALPSDHHATGLQLGEYISTRAVIDGEETVRYYSPISRNDAPTLDLCVKLQCDGGAMSTFFGAMVPGSTLDFKGPIAGLQHVVGSRKRVAMLAGGTGIAAMLQLMRAHVLYERKTGAEGCFDLPMIYACKNTDEILLREVLEGHARKHPNIRLFYSLMEPPEDWDQGVGFVTPEMIAEHFGAPGDDILVVVCGPPGMCKAMCGHLDALGFERGVNYYSYL